MVTGFKQLINIPTRVTDTTMSIVDLIFVNQPDDVLCHGTLPKIADHNGVIVSFNFKIDKVKEKTKTIYDYKNADVNGLIEYIKNYDFENNVFCYPIVQQTELYSNVLIDAFSKFIPSKNVVIRPSDAPWCNRFTEIIFFIRNVILITLML